LNRKPGPYRVLFRIFPRVAAFCLAVYGLALVKNPGLASGAPAKLVWHRIELGDPESLDSHKATT
jgi:hypothetical protein